MNPVHLYMSAANWCDQGSVVNRERKGSWVQAQACDLWSRQKKPITTKFVNMASVNSKFCWAKARPKFIAFHPEWPSIKQAVITRKILGNRDGRSLHQRKEINKESTSKLQADEAFHELLFGNRLCAQGSAIIQYDDQALGVGVQVVEQDNDGKIWVVCNDRRSAKGISTTPLRDATKPDRWTELQRPRGVPWQVWNKLPNFSWHRSTSW